MNWKATLLLMVVAAAVAVFVYVNPFQNVEEDRDDPPWFYQVSYDDVISIKILHNENEVSFKKVPPRAWVFDDPEGIPPYHARWGGIVLLLSGPQTKRDFSTVRATVDDPAEYGLDVPALTVDVGLTANRNVHFRLGDTTADGKFHYGQVIGFPQLFLIANTWGEVLARLADEPPIPKWYVKRDIATIEEVNIFAGEDSSVDNRVVRFQQEDGAWFVRDLAIDDNNRPVDVDKWVQYIPLMTGPSQIEIGALTVDDLDYTKWGIEKDGASIEVRFSGVSQRGTRFIDGVLLMIGDKTEDGQYYYATAASDHSVTPVLKLDRNWIDTMFGLLDDVPYGE